MTTHYLKIALRNMRRFKLQTIVCITGLAVGMTCFALGILWLRFVDSYEDFVPDVENVYLVTSGEYKSNNRTNYYTAFADGQQLAAERPEVKEYCTVRAYPNSNDQGIVKELRVGGQAQKVVAIYADSAFFHMFRIEPLAGDVRRIGRGEVVVTESLARRLFGSKPAVGQEVEVPTNPWSASADGYNTTVVGAVVPDCPRNTQFWYEVILPHDDFPQGHYNINFNTFVRLHANAVRDSIVERDMEVHYVTAKGYVYTHRLVLVPLSHLRSDYPSDNVVITTDYVRWFMLIGVLVILCSLTNYLITMVSHLRRRGWEFSLRRVLGSSSASVLYMVSLETFLLFLLATVSGALVITIVLPTFREYSSIDIPVSDIALRLAAYLSLVVVGGMTLSALTAWLVMHSTQRNVLSSRQNLSSPGRLRGAGVALQMALSMAIIFSTTVMLRQIRMLLYSDEMGFCHRSLAVVFSPGEALRQRIRQSPLVEGEAGENVYQLFPRLQDVKCWLNDNDNLHEWATLEVDYLPIDSVMNRLYSFQVVAGRLPIKEKYVSEADTTQIPVNGGEFYMTNISYKTEMCINETLCRQLGMSPEEAIGCESYPSPLCKTVICGVVKDMYIFGPTHQPSPTAYMLHSEYSAGVHWASFNEDNITFLAREGHLQELCDSIEAWKTVCEGADNARISNLEQLFKNFVASELMLMKILMAVGGASLFVCVIGTFSLVSLNLQRRRKEIAIRKVHGAKMRDILRLFLRGQVASLIIAALVAYPVAYIIMRHWLEGYLKQVGIAWWLMPATFAAIAAVVLGTITLKIWRAAKESTVSALNA